MPGPQVQKLVSQVEQSYTRLEQALQGISEQELRARPAPEEWSVAQALGHVIEMAPLWSSKAKAAAQQKTDLPAKRTPEEAQARLAAVERYGKESRAAILDGLRASKAKCIQAVSALQDADLDTPKVRDGAPMTVRGFLDKQIISHVNEHAEQVTAARKAAPKK
jgi:uncharacterized damage-inducible protein DinB